MRYVTLLVTPTEGEGFHPVGERIARDPDLTPEAIHRMDDLGDGTVTLLAEVTGDTERYREILANSPEVHEFTVADGDGNSAWGYSRTGTNDLTEYMLERDRELELVRDSPIEITDDGGQRVTLVGTEEAFVRAAQFDDPEGYEVEVEKTGEYHPDSGRLRRAGRVNSPLVGDSSNSFIPLESTTTLDGRGRLGHAAHPRTGELRRTLRGS